MISPLNLGTMRERIVGCDRYEYEKFNSFFIHWFSISHLLLRHNEEGYLGVSDKEIRENV